MTLKEIQLIEAFCNRTKSISEETTQEVFTTLLDKFTKQIKLKNAKRTQLDQNSETESELFQQES